MHASNEARSAAPQPAKRTLDDAGHVDKAAELPLKARIIGGATLIRQDIIIGGKRYARYATCEYDGPESKRYEDTPILSLEQHAGTRGGSSPSSYVAVHPTDQHDDDAGKKCDERNVRP